MSIRLPMSRRADLEARIASVRRLGPRLALEQRRLNARHARTSAETARQHSDEMWQEAAQHVGAVVLQLSPDLKEIRRGDATTHIGHLATTPLTDRVTFELTADKPLSLRLLAAAGIPTPEHVVVATDDLSAARTFMERVGAPLIVKPAVGKGGSGVVGHVTTSHQLERALRNVARSDARAMIERQAQGDSYRLLFLDGRLLDTVRHSPPRLRGDGVSTLQQLVIREFTRRIAAGGDPAGWKPFGIDLDCLTVIESTGYELGSVLDAGSEIRIRTATNFTGPDESVTYRGPLSPQIVAAALAAVNVLGPRLAGVDVVTSDVGLPLEETGGVVLEVNALPGLRHHYLVADPINATRVAVPILEALLNRPRGEPYRAQVT